MNHTVDTALAALVQVTRTALARIKSGDATPVEISSALRERAVLLRSLPIGSSLSASARANMLTLRDLDTELEAAMSTSLRLTQERLMQARRRNAAPSTTPQLVQEAA